MDPEPIDWSTAMEAVEGQTELLVELIELFLEEYPKHLDSMRVAARCGDGNGFARAAHTLKGSLKYFGPSRAAELALQLEQQGKSLAACDPGPRLVELEREIERMLPQLRDFIVGNS